VCGAVRAPLNHPGTREFSRSDLHKKEGGGREREDFRCSSQRRYNDPYNSGGTNATGRNGKEETEKKRERGRGKGEGVETASECQSPP